MKKVHIFVVTGDGSSWVQPTVSHGFFGSRFNIFNTGSVSSLGRDLSCVHHPVASLGLERWSPLSQVLSPSTLSTQMHT